MNPISATLSPDDRATIAQALEQIRDRLPFLVDLMAEERKSIPKMGDKSRTFVNKALDMASKNAEFLPRSFDVAEMRKDVQLFDDLSSLSLSLVQLQDLVDDTCMALGNEAYTAALTVYNYAKTTGQKTDGLEPLVDEMRQHFRKPRKAKAKVAAIAG
ncbi:hypothetical protein [Stenomitos frigidus]|uniref:Uncharacterized protein n=1 Tax=Stenomitos frigidus ULC18 TaxID=2107698 RepID=A0A2T1EDB7_9CYAN|nr:hypothetical protein [Stenomitos frigidus]PSB30756.1 hypothetical protein C7B82_08035 [Stenomitos frigidus ULC18]